MCINDPEDAPSPDAEQTRPDDRTFIYQGPLFLKGKKPDLERSHELVSMGDNSVQETVKVTGKEKFEHMVLYCLTLLHRAEGRICAFYLDDFDDCDEFTLRVIQQLIAKAGFTTSDFLEQPRKNYKGFWAWHKG